MDDAQTDQFRQRLLALQARLQDLQATGDAASRIVTLDQSSVGRLSRMDALQGQAMSQERGRRRALELQRIAAALGRLDSGDFGYCLRCDEAIALPRLELDPAATLCIECASSNEKT